MPTLSPICRNCQNPFEIDELDQNFLHKMQIPNPTLCPQCRVQRRMSWRNDRNLYERTCDFSGEKIISMFSPNSKVPVIHKNLWWSDSWDGRKYGREIDWNRPIFEQFHELLTSTPLPHIMVASDDNSLYTNYTMANKNCFMSFAGNYLEDGLYCYNAENSRDSADTLFINNCELCYECVHCSHCYDLKFSLNSRNCRNSAFLEDCSNCQNCFMCWNLNGQEYCFMNQKYSKEDYEKLVAQYDLKNPELLQKALQLWNQERPRQIKPENHNISAEDCEGEYIQNSKNCRDCYIMAHGGEDCRHVVNGFPGLKDSQDCTYSGENTSLLYECMASGSECYQLMFCNVCVVGSSNLAYCNVVFTSKNCFACTSLRNAEYCIFNKQYTKEEYETLLPRLIEHMKKTGEYGEFFPTEISPFAYHETLAQDFFPKPLPVEAPRPASIDALTCKTCQKSFRLNKQELNFYQKIGVTQPVNCFDCRHRRRLSIRSPYATLQRNCSNCQKTVFTHETAPLLYCEDCYLKTVY